MKYTDKQLLDFLQSKNDEKRYTGRCICRMSGTGRGWRIHETSGMGAKESVRESIIDAIKRENE